MGDIKSMSSGQNDLISRQQVTDHKRFVRQTVDANDDFIERLYKLLETTSADLIASEQKYQQERDAKEKISAEKLALEVEMAQQKKTFEEKISKLEAEKSDLQASLEKALNEAKLLAEQVGLLTAECEGLKAELKRQADEFKSELDSTTAKFQAELEAQEIFYKNKLKESEGIASGFLQMKTKIDGFHVGDGVLKEPCGAFMLPNNNVLVADTLAGLFLFSSFGEVLRHVESDLWKWPQAVTFDRVKDELIVTLIKRDDVKNVWGRQLGHFSPNLDEIKFETGPDVSEGFENIGKESLAISPDGILFLSVSDGAGTAIWRRSVRGEWNSVTKRAGAAFTDLSCLSSNGVVVQLLVIESKMGYLNRLAISGDQIADRKSLAVVPKPNCVCVDEIGNVFVHDVESGKISLIDDVKFEVKRDVAVVDDSVFAITAAHGWLAVAVRAAKIVRIFRYAQTSEELMANKFDLTRPVPKHHQVQH